MICPRSGVELGLVHTDLDAVFVYRRDFKSLRTANYRIRTSMP
jgi:hypothetical protein